MCHFLVVLMELILHSLSHIVETANSRSYWMVSVQFYYQDNFNISKYVHIMKFRLVVFYELCEQVSAIMNNFNRNQVSRLIADIVWIKRLAINIIISKQLDKILNKNKLVALHCQCRQLSIVSADIVCSNILIIIVKLSKV